MAINFPDNRDQLVPPQPSGPIQTGDVYVYNGTTYVATVLTDSSVRWDAAVSAGSDAYVLKVGDTMTGQLTLPGGGTGSNAATVDQITSAIPAALWQRDGGTSTLSPATANDNLNQGSGNITTTGDLGAAAGTFTGDVSAANVTTTGKTVFGTGLTGSQSAITVGNSLVDPSRTVDIRRDGVFRTATDVVTEGQGKFGLTQTGTQPCIVVQDDEAGTNRVFEVDKSGKVIASSDVVADGQGKFGLTQTGTQPCIVVQDDDVGTNRVFEVDKSGKVIAGSGSITLESDGYGAFWRSTTTASNLILRGFSNVGGTKQEKFFVRSDGIIGAVTTSISPITSERRLKENITPVDSVTAWETIKSVPYYTYNFIGGDSVNYGPMADEVPDEMRVDTGRTDDVGVIHTYDNGMLQARLYVALQTALTRIEALEAEVQSLKGGSN